MHLSEKTKNLLDKACKARFGISFDTLYQNIEAQQKQKEALKAQQKYLKK